MPRAWMPRECSNVLYTISASKRWEHLNNIFFTILETRTHVRA